MRASSSGGGHRCGERAFVEFHHVRPYGVGGEASVENIELRCRAHNQYEADLFYGNPTADGSDVRQRSAERPCFLGFSLVLERVNLPETATLRGRA